MQISANKKIFSYLEKMTKAGEPLLALQGARRAGKTYTTCQWLLLRMLQYGEVVVCASMTAEQGRRGVYEDCKNILKTFGAVADYFNVLKSPREISCECGDKTGVMYFASFQDPESAKGVACDWVFINEANKFTKQQYYDLAANARKGVIIDYNPQKKFWVSEVLADDKVLRVSWQDNKKHLTAAQLDWFEQLKRAAESPTATAADRYYYEVYYNGNYSDVSGAIFTRANTKIIQPADVDYSSLKILTLFGDPSALRGADYFPLVLAGSNEAGEVFILDVYSTNIGTNADIIKQIQRMAGSVDNCRIYIETNGIIGVEFYEFAVNSGLPIEGWCSRGNKFERIISHYQEWCNSLYFVDSPLLSNFLDMCYNFGEKCEHDDNPDAVCSTLQLHKLLRSYL